MPVLDQTPNGPDPVFKTQSALGSFLDQAKGTASSILQPAVQALHQYGVLKSKPHDTRPLQQPPAEAAVPAGDTLLVFGRRLPIGAVMTRCTVDERVGYRPMPLSDVTPVSIEEFVSQQLEKKREKGTNGQPDSMVLQASYRASAKKARFQGSSAAHTAAGLAIDALNTKKAATASLVEKQAQVNLATAAALRQTAVESGIFKLRGKVGKVYLGDPEPRRAQLQFIVHDVVSILSNGRQEISNQRNRYEVLRALRAMFCDNENGRAPYDSAYSILADAARLTASAVAGHLVHLSAPGLNPYNVDQWLVSSFKHIEVETHNVIAVQVQLVEYISVLAAKITDPNNSPKVQDTLPAPATPTRPSYVGSALPGVTP